MGEREYSVSKTNEFIKLKRRGKKPTEWSNISVFSVSKEIENGTEKCFTAKFDSDESYAFLVSLMVRLFGLFYSGNRITKWFANVSASFGLWFFFLILLFLFLFFFAFFTCKSRAFSFRCIARSYRLLWTIYTRKTAFRVAADYRFLLQLWTRMYNSNHPIVHVFYVQKDLLCFSFISYSFCLLFS